MGTPAQQAADADLAQQVAAVPAHIRAAIAQGALRSQRSVNAWPYYSRVIVSCLATGPGPFAYAIPTGQQAIAFGYAFGAANVVPIIGAGAAVPATIADTNLTNPNQTVKKEAVMVYGVSITIGVPSSPDGEQFGSRQLMQWCADSLSLQVTGGGGDVIAKLGPLGMHAGRSGLFGPGQEATQISDLISSLSPATTSPTLANPNTTSYFAFPYGISWASSGTPSPDAEFGIVVRSERAFAGVAPADRPAAAGVAAWTHPSALKVELLFELITNTQSLRSSNQ